MSEVAVPEPDHALIAVTGEVIPLDDPAACGKALRWIRQAKQQLTEAQKLLTAAVVEHAQTAGTKTLHVDGLDRPLKLSGGPGADLWWDVEALRVLLDMGLPPERFAELVTEEISYKVNANVARSIASINPDYARVIEAARHRIDKPWSVS